MKLKREVVPPEDEEEEIIGGGFSKKQEEEEVEEEGIDNNLNVDKRNHEQLCDMISMLEQKLETVMTMQQKNNVTIEDMKKTMELNKEGSIESTD